MKQLKLIRNILLSLLLVLTALDIAPSVVFASTINSHEIQYDISEEVMDEELTTALAEMDYANLSQSTRTITFNPQGGTWAAPGSGTGNVTRTMLQSAVSFATVMNTNNTALLNPAQVAPTRVGYTFAGWFTAPTGGTHVNQFTLVMPGTTAITLHARWTPTP